MADEGESVGFAEPTNINEAAAYKASFGFLENKSQYAGGMDTVQDVRDNLKDTLETGLKAQSTTSGGAGTAGQALIPVYVDPRIVDQSRKYTPWTEILPRVSNQGITADYNVIESKESAEFAAEGAALSDQDSTENRKSQSIKFLYAKGKVTGPAQASYPSYMLQGFEAQGAGRAGTTFTDQQAMNAKQLKVLKRARALREREEQAIWQGDSSSNSLEFDGIPTLQGTTNQVDASSSALNYGHTEDAVENAADDSNGAGRPNIGAAHFNVVKQLRNIMIDLFNYRPADMQSESLPFGVQSHINLETMVGPIPIIPSGQMTSTDGNQELFFLDMDIIEMRNLLDMTFEDKPDEDDNQVFLLKAYETMIMRAPQFNGFVDNLASV